MVEETGPCVVVALHHRTIVVSIEVELLAPPPPSSPSMAATSSSADAASTIFMVWARIVPRRERRFADGVYTVTSPVPLGCVAYAPAELPQSCPARLHRNHTAALSLGRWELCAGTRVVLTLARPDTAVSVVHSAMEAALHRKKAIAHHPQKEGEEQQQREQMGSALAAHWRLCGCQVATADTAVNEVEWQPLLHRRWYELKSYVRQGTTVPYAPSGCQANETESGSEASTLSPVMYAGDVREAEAVSVNRQCVLWVGGGVGLYDEVKPFCRVYQPVRPEKTVRVRRFPHRYADVVGEVPFGLCVEALGRTTDPFTQEQYVLLYLPAGEAFAHHISTYDLTFVEEGRFLWGWSKLAGSSGLLLLRECQSDDGVPISGSDRTIAASPSSLSSAPALGATTPVASTTRVSDAVVKDEADGKAEVMLLPEGTFYTPVREGRVVRIRRRPTLTAATLRQMEVNEVRAAVALLTVAVCAPSDPAGAAIPHVFVKWRQGGYSLLRNEVECFLVPVLLSRVPRRFPIYTRSTCGDGAGASDGEAEVGEKAVIDLSRPRARKRGRYATNSDDGDKDAELQAMLQRHRMPRAAVTTDDSLLSPYDLPASLQEGLRKGVVRLEDLPPLHQPSQKEEEEEDDDDSDDSDSLGEW